MNMESIKCELCEATDKVAEAGLPTVDTKVHYLCIPCFNFYNSYFNVIHTYGMTHDQYGL